jgi:hypothetical protein
MKRVAAARPKLLLALLALLVAAAAASAWNPEALSRDASPVPAAAAARAPGRNEVALLALPERTPAPAAREDLFEPRSWRPPAPPPRFVPPPKPTAPALPFSYLGRITENGTTKVFLKKGDELLVARENQEIDGSYRVEAIDDGRIAFLYLPLHARQELLIGPPK